MTKKSTNSKHSSIIVCYVSFKFLINTEVKYLEQKKERERGKLHLNLSFSKLGHQMHLVAAMILHGGRLESFIDPQRKEGRCKLRGREIETRSRRRGGSAEGRRLTQ